MCSLFSISAKTVLSPWQSSIRASRCFLIFCSSSLVARIKPEGDSLLNIISSPLHLPFIKYSGVTEKISASLRIVAMLLGYLPRLHVLTVLTALFVALDMSTSLMFLFPINVLIRLWSSSWRRRCPLALRCARPSAASSAQRNPYYYNI